jgi:hypothetical protein
MGRDGQAPGSAGVGGAVLLRPDEQVMEAMLEGWRAQHLARNVAFSTIGKRLTAVAAFARHADAFPWAWTAQMADEWPADLRGGERTAPLHYPQLRWKIGRADPDVTRRAVRSRWPVGRVLCWGAADLVDSGRK